MALLNKMPFITHNLYGIKSLTDDDLPENYNSRDVYYHYNNKLGVCLCQKCGIRKKHELNWQQDACYQKNH